MKIPKTIVSRIFYIGAILLPISIRLLLPNLYHHFDVHTFKDWISATEPWRNIYLTNCYCNYPIVGLFFSTGIIQLMGGSIFLFLCFLAVVDALNIFLLFKLLQRLKIRSAMLIAGGIGLLPSSWIGGALWGQIDTIGQTILLALLLLCLPLFQNKKQSFFLASAIGLLVLIALLTKQLLLFPLIALGIGIFKHLLEQDRTYLLKWLTFGALGFLVPLVLIELWLYIPEKYFFFHFEKIIDTGSDHMNFISGNGFNFWMLVYSNQDGTSLDPILLGLSPKQIGLLLEAVFIAPILVVFFRKKISVYGVLNLICLINLSFNLFFTGTHERYLYHFYPFLFLLLAYRHTYLKKVSIPIWLGATFCASIYGTFVYGAMQGMETTNWFFQSYIAHRITFFIHLPLLVILTFNYYTNIHE